MAPPPHTWLRSVRLIFSCSAFHTASSTLARFQTAPEAPASPPLFLQSFIAFTRWKRKASRGEKSSPAPIVSFYGCAPPPFFPLPTLLQQKAQITSNPGSEKGELGDLRGTGSVSARRPLTPKADCLFGNTGGGFRDGAASSKDVMWSVSSVKRNNSAPDSGLFT